MRAALVSIVLAMAMVAGCMDDPPEPATQSTSLAPAPPATVTETTGGIQGTVFNDEGLPAAGTTVGLLEAPIETKTDNLGVFSFSELEPRKYRIAYERFGFESGVLENVEVFAGEVTHVNITLKAKAVPKAYNRTIAVNGRIELGGAQSELLICDGVFETCKFFFDLTSNKSLESVGLELDYTPTMGHPLDDDKMFFQLWDYDELYNSEVTEDVDPVRDGFWKDGDAILVHRPPTRNWTNGWRMEIDNYCHLEWPCMGQDFKIWVTFFYYEKAPDTWAGAKKT